MSLHLFLSFLLLSIFSYTYNSLYKQEITSLYIQPAWNETLDFNLIEHQLKKEKIISLIPMAEHLKNEHYDADNRVF